MDDQKPLISVAMATKNGMPHISAAIEGLRRQTYGKFELIVQDALSTDGTVEYLHGLELPFPMHIVSEADESLVDGYARAWRRSRGDLVVSGACDEVYEPDAFESYVRWHREHPKAVFIYSGSRLIDSQGATVSEFRPQPFDLLDYLRHDMCPTAAGAFKRELLGEDFRLDDSLIYVPDFELFTRLALKFGDECLIAKEQITISARADGASLSYSPRHFRAFGEIKQQIIERLLTGEWRDAFTQYLRRDFSGRMHISFAKLIDSIEGPTDNYADHVLAASDQGVREEEVERLAGEASQLFWDANSGRAERRLSPVAAEPPPGEAAWNQPLLGLQLINEGAALAWNDTGAVTCSAAQAGGLAILPMEIPALPMRESPAWVRIRISAIGGEVTLSLHDRARGQTMQLHRPSRAGDVLIPFANAAFDHLLIRNETDAPCAVTLVSVELVSAALQGEPSLCARLGRRWPVGPDERDLLRNAITGLQAAAPPDGWERLSPQIAAIAASGDLTRSVYGLADEQVKTVGRAADYALRMALGRAAAEPHRIDGGPRPATRLCSTADWHDPAGLGLLVKIFGQDARLLRAQNRWVWERMALAGAVRAGERVLIVLDAPDSIGPILAHLGAIVTYAGTAEVLGAGPALNGWEATFAGSWLKPKDQGRPWTPGAAEAPFDVVILMGSRLIPPGSDDLDRLLQAIADEVAPEGRLLLALPVQLNAKTYDGALTLGEWESLFEPQGPLGARGFTPWGDADLRIPADTLVRYIPGDVGEAAIPGLSTGYGDSLMTSAVIAATWPRDLSPGPLERLAVHETPRRLDEVKVPWGAPETLWDGAGDIAAYRFTWSGGGSTAAEDVGPDVQEKESHPLPFALSDYYKMFRSRGIRLPVTYFFQAHLFDLIHGTDTHHWLPREDYEGDLAKTVHGQYYMCSWTKEVRKAYRFLRGRLGNGLGDWSFVDIGCGKGKICLIWSMLASRDKLAPRIVGVEYSRQLAETARANTARVRAGRNVEILTADATALDYATLGDRIVFYLYNPFDAVVMEAFVKRLAGIPHVIVYVNPVESEWLKAHGYRVIWEQAGWQHRDTIMILQPADQADL